MAGRTIAAPLPGGRGLTAPGRPLSAFRHREFRFLLASTMALQVGSWVQTIGQGWLVKHDLGGSATDLGLVALARGGSLLLVSPLGGFVASKFERRKQLMFYTLVSAVIATLLAVLIAAGRIEIWMVYVTAVVAGVVEALAGPIRGLLVYESVKGEDLTAAVALNALGGNAMRVIGPAIGGALIGSVGTEGAFEVQAGCIVLALGLTWFLSKSHPTLAEQRERFVQSLAGGLRYVTRDPTMRVIVLMGFLPSLLVYPYVTFLPVFAKDVLHSDESGYGYLAAAVGLGSLVGGTVVAFTAGGRRKMGPPMIWTCFIYASFVGVFTLTRDLWLAVAALAVAGVFHSMYSAYQASLMQLQSAPEYRSRVLSLQTMMWGSTPFVALGMGQLIDRYEAPHVVGAFMAAAAVLTLVVYGASKNVRRV